MNIKSNRVAACWAAEILVRHLGGTTDEWDAFLTENHSLDEDEREIPFSKVWGQVTYELSDLYKYIFHEAPEVLGLGRALGIGSVDGSSFACSASHAVNYEHSGEIVVELEFSKFFNGRALMSPEAARKLSAQLIDAAAACETHAFDVVRWKVVPRDQVLDVSKLGLTTGDLELDLLLAEFDEGGTKKEGPPVKEKAAR